jgi:phage terminase large subunit-like protein
MTAPATPAIKAMAGDPARVLALGDTPLRRMILPFIHAFLLRPDQVIPCDGWKWFVLRGGRGWGKTWAIACYLVGEVMSGAATAIALMATNEDRVDEIQIDALIKASPPWFRPVRSRGGLEWPNGVRAEVFTPEAPDAIRSQNLSHTWLCEVLAWPATKRMLAFQNATTATRIGKAQVLIDTTAQGRNDVIALINKMHDGDPRLYRIVRGSTVDNPIFSRDYLRSEFLKYAEGSRRFEEEIMGKDFGDALGALWTSDLIEAGRVLVAPSPLDITLIGLDPAYSGRVDADNTGIVVAGRKGRDVYVLKDLSGQHGPEQWADLVCTTALAMRAAGVVIEVNSTVDALPAILRGACKTHGLVMIEVPRDQPVPPYRAGVLYCKRITSRVDKYQRATGPQGESVAGRLHIVGELPVLESRMTMWEPESKDRSPGELDAMVHVVNELAGLTLPGVADSSQAVLQTAAAAKELHARMTRAAAGRRVGL